MLPNATEWNEGVKLQELVAVTSQAAHVSVSYVSIGSLTCWLALLRLSSIEAYRKDFAD
jgi:hypothetical protein